MRVKGQVFFIALITAKNLSIANDFAFFILKIFIATKAIHSNNLLKRGKREHCKVSPSMLERTF